MTSKKPLVLALIFITIGIVSASGILRLRGAAPNASAIEAYGNLAVYWDQSCSQRVSSMEWGTLSPGEAKQITVYVRNEGSGACMLTLRPTRWSPAEACKYLRFSWTCGSRMIESGNVAKVIQTLTVSPDMTEITSFTFNIIYEVRTYLLLGDFDDVFAQNRYARMIYPSDTPNKPLGCSPASVSDWIASAFIYTKLANGIEGLDTEEGFVNKTTGESIGDAGTAIVSFGGPCVNPIVKYAESAATPETNRAPIKFNLEGQTCQFLFSNDSRIDGAEMPITAVSSDQDMFVIEIYKDEKDRYILLCYGFGWKGTYAAGKYFHSIIYPNLELHTESWIIVKWEDTNQNRFVNASGEGDTYTIISRGN